MAAAPPPTGDVTAWSVPDVAAWLEGLHVPEDAIAAFRSNAVAGADLASLSDDDLRTHLGLPPLLVSGAVLARVQRRSLALSLSPARPPPPKRTAPLHACRCASCGQS